MGDTVVFQGPGEVWLAHNATREADEPQHLEHLPLHRGPLTQAASHCEVSVPESRQAAIMYRPEGVWGATGGVNQHGVAIGMQPVATRLGPAQPSLARLFKSRKASLLGEDLLRLALEQSRSSRDARDVITGYLEEYGQGGPARPVKRRWCHDSSFILADFHEAWVLETAGRFWAARRVDGYAAIANDLTIETRFDLGATGMEDFARKRGWARKHEDFSFRGSFRRRLAPWLSRASVRRERNLAALAALDRTSPRSEQDFIALLRHHARAQPGSRADICRHPSGRRKPLCTVSSLITRTAFSGLPQAWICDGQPCSSDFRQALFLPPGK